MLISCIGEVEMRGKTHELTFHGELLDRGFWLYVWEITTPKQGLVYYVGRTGDSSSSNAQSPFNRMGQHLGFNARSNVLRRHLKSKGIDPHKCIFRLVAHGPILEEATTREAHLGRRDRIASLEKALAQALAASGYRVMNKIHCRMRLDPKAFVVVRAAFAIHFKKLAGERTAVVVSESSGVQSGHGMNT
jgi:hypothetical protein